MSRASGAPELSRTYVLTRAAGRSATGEVAALQAALQRIGGQRLAGLFVIPQIAPVGSGRRSFTWSDALPGNAQPLGRCSPDVRRAAEDELRACFTLLAPHLDDPADGPLLRSALYVAGEFSFYACDGGARIVGWGLLPASCHGDATLRGRHFDDTTGRFAPFPAPALDDAPVPALVADNGMVLPGTAAGSNPYLAPAIALGVLCTVLALLLLPGVLRYGGTSALDPAPPVAPMLQAYNDGLREQIREAERILATPEALCTAPRGARSDRGAAADGDASTQAGGAPSRPAVDALAPPPPSAVPLPADHTAGANGVGRLDDLLDKATVLVLTPDGTGSGFFVGPGLIATNSHVVDEHARVVVVNRSTSRPLQGSVKARTPKPREPGEPDFALIQVEGSLEDHPTLPLAEPVRRLQAVTAAGFPFIVLENDEHFRRLREGDASAVPGMAVSQGAVMVVQEGRDGTPFVLHQAMTSPGNSGGPLVDLCGRAVGVNTFVRFGDDTGARVNIALGASALASFLAQNGHAVPVSGNTCQQGQLGEPSPTAPPDARQGTPEAAGSPPPAPGAN